MTELVWQEPHPAALIASAHQDSAALHARVLPDQLEVVQASDLDVAAGLRSQSPTAPRLPNGQAERRAQRVRSSPLFGGISVSPPSWQQLERPRKTRTDTDGGEIATIRVSTQ